MKIPPRLQPLIHAHLIEDVVGQLQSGKEAEVYIVLSEGEYRCAKVYKEANSRTFKHRAQYTEGRSVRSSRRGRAMANNSKFGKKEQESEWQNTEVEALTALSAAGVRVPQTYAYYEGVLLLQMIVDKEGNAAPRLNDVELTAQEARDYHEILIRQVVRMLCAGYVHGDLSEFNVLVSQDGLVIIDLPQAVQATSNSAFSIFERDLIQLAAYFGRYAPEIQATEYAKEIWKLYQNGKLRPDTKLTGKIAQSSKKVDVESVFEEIEAARDDEMERRGIRKKPSYK
jgi:RIO kinase 1